ncbi:MAG: addiction module protein [Deltaproteobacteria bacterium]|nr:addiction module protein [Deltaproteobacteria bacterium]
MTSAARDVLQAALALPADEREQLVGALSTSLEPSSVSPSWAQEIARRLTKIESGEATFHDAEEHLRALRAKYG